MAFGSGRALRVEAGALPFAGDGLLAYRKRVAEFGIVVRRVGVVLADCDWMVNRGILCFLGKVHVNLYVEVAHAVGGKRVLQGLKDLRAVVSLAFADKLFLLFDQVKAVAFGHALKVV